VASWEHAIAERLRLLGLDTIRRRILAFGVLATLIPSLITGTISYAENHRALSEKIADQLRVASFQSAREVDLFFRDRLYDLRVFSNSYEVSENLERLGSAGTAPGSVAVRRLTEYLQSVKVRSTDYEEVMVLDRQGRVVASSAAKPGPVTLPGDWRRDMGTDQPVVGQPYWDAGLDKAVVVLAVPIVRNDQVLGAVSGRVRMEAVATILRRSTPGDSGQVALLTGPGGFIITSRVSTPELMQSRLEGEAIQALAAQIGNPVEFSDAQVGRMLGTLQQVPRLDGVVVASLPLIEAFQQVNRLRNVTILMVVGLLVGVGGLAYILSLVIVRPLERLREGAAQVAAGDLDVNLPVMGGGEVSYLTEIFNDMVRRLRESRQELERISVTDGLTGLVNRRRLMEALATEVQRAARTEQPCIVLMIDVDHFKQFNDTYGHPAGDAVLTRVAAILRESIRAVDVAGRYGGEEFLLVLTDTTMAGALEVAERIRSKLATEVFDGGRITVSVGAAQYPDGGRTAEALIMSADLALYQAKKEGRDRVVQATSEAAREQP
jgi:diguanylate cyclase (GGDEF)-like protein